MLETATSSARSAALTSKGRFGVDVVSALSEREAVAANEFEERWSLVLRDGTSGSDSTGIGASSGAAVGWFSTGAMAAVATREFEVASSRLLPHTPTVRVDVVQRGCTIPREHACSLRNCRAKRWWQLCSDDTLYASCSADTPLRFA